MQFRDIIGQLHITESLASDRSKRRVPHARLFVAPSGTGALPTAVAYASYLLCENPHDGDSCGVCKACKQSRHLAHPDLHFAFPTVKSELSDKYLDKWREMFAEMPYFDMPMWTSKIASENAKPIIYANEADAIMQKLNLKSSQGGYKVMIVWMAERMNETCANRLLKLIEEPPAGTVFIFITENADAVLPTIVSRTQMVHFPPLPEGEVRQALLSHYGISEEDAARAAHLAAGSMLRAAAMLQVNVEEQEHFERFKKLMRLAFKRDMRELYAWSEALATLGREKQKNFLDYANRLVRENFIKNMGVPRLLYMNATEEEFSKNFSPYVNERNVAGLMAELEHAARDIEQNVNSRMVLFDLALRMCVLILKPT